VGNLLESRLRATPAQLLAHWRHVASGSSVHAVLRRERDADADVIGNADLALYRAKAGGRSTSCFFNADIENAAP
jgi:GGDEF domain-containing protein